MVTLRSALPRLPLRNGRLGGHVLNLRAIDYYCRSERERAERDANPAAVGVPRPEPLEGAWDRA
jgi:hypothetical protein